MPLPWLAPVALLAGAAPDPELEGMPGPPPEPSGFAAPAEPVSEAAPAPPPFSPEVRFGGSFATRVDADLADEGQHEDVLEGRLRLDLELAARLSPRTTALVSGRLAHESRTPDMAFDGARYGHDVELREARFSWQGEGVGVDVGNLFLRWGVADAASPNDVLNPQDFRDSAPVAFETPLVPVPAVRLTASPGDFAFELDVLPFFEPHRAALFGTDWAPVGANPQVAALSGLVDQALSRAAIEDAQPLLLSSNPPDESPRNATVGTRVGWHGPGVDVHLNAMHGWDRVPATTLDPDFLALVEAVRDDDLPAQLAVFGRLRPRLAAGEALFESTYRRQNLVGADAAWAVGDFLLKAEAAHSFARTLYLADFTPVRTASLSWAAGFDWLPDPDLDVTLECFGLRPSEAGDYLFLGRQLVNLTAHVRWAPLTDTLTLELLGQYGLTRGDHTLAPSLRWQPADGHALSAGVYVLAGPDDSVGGVFDPNDAGWARYTLSF